MLLLLLRWFYRLNVCVPTKFMFETYHSDSILDFPANRNIRNKLLMFISHPVYVILLQQLEQIRQILNTNFPQLSFTSVPSTIFHFSANSVCVCVTCMHTQYGAQTFCLSLMLSHLWWIHLYKQQLPCHQKKKKKLKNLKNVQIHLMVYTCLEDKSELQNIPKDYFNWSQLKL